MPLTPIIVSMPPARRGGASLHTELARRIGTGIIDGTYKPGTVLPNEAKWSAMFGASRTAVREAIKTLVGKGLIVPRPRVGSRVEPRDRWNLLDRDVLAWHSAAAKNDGEVLRAIQDARRIIEPSAAELAATRRRPEQLAALSAAFDDMKKAQSTKQLIAADVRFHLTLLASANNLLLTPFGIAIEQALWQLHDYSVRNNPRPEYVLALHGAVYEAVAAGDGRAARLTMLEILGETDGLIHPPETKVRKARGKN